MVDVRAFRGIRYDTTRLGPDLTRVVCPPYDIISPARQQALYDSHDENFVRLELTPALPNELTEGRYARAGAQFRDWLRSGVLQTEAEPALYAYHQTFDLEGSRHERRAVMAAVHLEPWERRQVLRHELTLAGPKVDRLELMRACEANFSPIWGLYRDGTQATEQLWEDRLTHPCAASAIDDDGVEHRIWVVTDADQIAAFQRALAAGPVYIADGHHRYETAMRYQSDAITAGSIPTADSAANFVLAYLVEASDPSLTVFGTHRLLATPRPLERAALVEVLQRWFRVREVSGDAATLLAAVESAGPAPAFGILSPSQGISLLVQCAQLDGVPLELAAGHSGAWRMLDLAALHTLTIDQLFEEGSSALADSGRLWYTRSLDEVTAALNGPADIAFLVRHTPVSQTMAVAEAGDLMPQKSTYFYPKPLSGLVVAGLAGEVGPAAL